MFHARSRDKISLNRKLIGILILSVGSCIQSFFLIEPAHATPRSILTFTRSSIPVLTDPCARVRIRGNSGTNYVGQDLNRAVIKVDNHLINDDDDINCEIFREHDNIEMDGRERATMRALLRKRTPPPGQNTITSLIPWFIYIYIKPIYVTYIYTFNHLLY